jgi:precorrin-6B methylase 2
MFMALLASSVLATAAPAFAQQDVDEIIIGGSMPLTGVFAFAGSATM